MPELSESSEVPTTSSNSRERDAPSTDDGRGDAKVSDAIGEDESELALEHEFVPDDDGWGHDAGTRRGRREAAIEAARAQVREALEPTADAEANSKPPPDLPPATDASSDQRADLTESETAAIRDYTKSNYLSINDNLRHGRELPPNEAKQVEHIDAALEKLPSEELMLFRGVHLSEAEAGRYVPGYLVTEHHYTSASHEPDRSFRGNTDFVILAHNGKSLEDLSWESDEHEVVVPRHTDFKVTAVDVDTDFGRRTIYMEEYVDDQ